MRFQYLLLLLFPLLILGCGQRSFEREMINLDRSFIPALYFTSHGSIDAAQKAIRNLRFSWETINIKYYNFRPEDNEWKDTFDLIDQHIIAAAALVANQKDFSLAETELRAVSDLLYKLRAKKHIRYYLDNLYEFDRPLRAIDMLTRGKKAEQVTDEDFRNLKWLTLKEISIWDKVAKREFNGRLFGFDGDKMSEMKRWIKGEESILRRFQEAIEKHDSKYVVLAASYLYPNYQNLYLMFGDFKLVPNK